MTPWPRIFVLSGRGEDDAEGTYFPRSGNFGRRSVPFFPLQENRYVTWLANNGASSWETVPFPLLIPKLLLLDVIRRGASLAFFRPEHKRRR